MGTVRELFREIGNLFRWWFIVTPWEQAIRVRRGNKVEVLGAGLHLRIPIIDRIFRQSTRRRFSSIPTQTITTTDGRTVTVSGTLGYAIADIGTLYNTLHHAEETIMSEAQGMVGRFVAASTYEDCTPAKVEAHVRERLNLGRYGLSDMEFYVTDYAAVKTYRLIQGGPKDWRDDGDALNTTREESEP